jgi:hypothetical protein
VGNRRTRSRQTPHDERKVIRRADIRWIGMVDDVPNPDITIAIALQPLRKARAREADLEQIFPFMLSSVDRYFLHHVSTDRLPDGLELAQVHLARGACYFIKHRHLLEDRIREAVERRWVNLGLGDIERVSSLSSEDLRMLCEEIAEVLESLAPARNRPANRVAYDLLTEMGSYWWHTFGKFPSARTGLKRGLSFLDWLNAWVKAREESLLQQGVEFVHEPQGLTDSLLKKVFPKIKEWKGRTPLCRTDPSKPYPLR